MPIRPKPGTALVPTQDGNNHIQDLPPLEGLTTMQSAFVRCYVLTGDGNAAAAAREAGYAPEHAAQIGSRLVHHQGVQRAMIQMTQQTFAAHAPVALAAMARLAKGARSEFVQQQAAADLLNRAGLAAPDKLAIAIKGDITFHIDLG